jgi:hypothetical protein
MTDNEAYVYLPTIQEIKQNENNFVYHAPKGNQQARYEELRAKAKSFADMILISCPPSREKSLALTKLEECVFWCNASIARNE